MDGSRYRSWGGFPRVKQKVLRADWSRSGKFVQNGSEAGEDRSFLPFGNGRSYGDSCLNEGGILLSTEQLDRFISFDAQEGVLRAESGVTLEEILKVIVPRGWFLPVTPGTQYVTLGGAVANDVHGKNHHRAGTFGCHVRQFELLRSDGTRVHCSPEKEPDLFRATVGGLGLTGLLTWVEIGLKKIANPFIDVESIKFGSLDEFFEISRQSDRDFEYTVAWLDCVSSGDSFGRGIFLRGNHSSRPRNLLPKEKIRKKVSVPFPFPGFALNPFSIKAFNTAYYHRQVAKLVSSTQHYDPFFYPLDAVLSWNRIYGRRGFLQFQCVVPKESDSNESGHGAIREILKFIVAEGSGSFLAVLKEFGDVTSPGMLSFPMPGVTLCLDFPHLGERTMELFRELDKRVRAAKGRLYPAKDATMAPESFALYYPSWQEFTKYMDPRFSSSFWRRVTVGS